MDDMAQKLLHQLALSADKSDGYSLKDGIIRLHGEIWIGANTALKTKLISAFHDSAVGGHSSIQATY